MPERSPLSPFSRRVLRAIVLVAIALVVLLFGHFAAQELFVLFGGVLFAIALHGASAWIAAHTRLPHKVVVGGLALALLATGATSAWMAGPSLAEQAHKLVQELPRAYHDALARARKEPLLQPLVTSAPAAPEPQASHAKPPPSDPAHAAQSAPSGPSGEAAPGGAASAVASGAAGVLRGVSEITGALILIFFVGVYGAADPEAYMRPFLALLPARRRARVADVLRGSASSLARWLLGRGVAMLFVGVCTSVVLALLKIPLAIVLGVLSGLLAFVEYAGAWISAIPVVLMALTVGPTQVVAVLALYTFVHVIEGYVLTPLLARTAVSFPPGYTLCFQVLFGALYGPLGITFSTPLMIVVIVAVKKLYVEDVLEGGAREESSS